MTSRTLAVTCLAAPALVAVATPFSERLWRDQGFWGDGRAEVAIFSAEEKRYGTLRATEVRHILVREDFAAQEQAKADDWQSPGTYPVIKLNQIIDVPTGTYGYHQGHSSFWRQDNGRLLKFASTTNDSCGLSYKQGNRLGSRWRYRAFTYWEGMTEVNHDADPPADALFYDELPFKLRTIDFGQVTRFEAPLMNSVIDSRANALTWTSAEFAVQRTDEGWQVTVKHARGTDHFTFDRAVPHALKRWRRWDDSKLERIHLIRIPYWKLNQPGDERYLQPGATYP